MNPPPAGPKRVVVVANGSLRGTLLAIGAGIVMLIFVVYGVVHMGSPVKGNKLTGTITEKEFIPLKEKQINFDGRRIKGIKEKDGDYIFKVHVAEQNRTYDVPVEESTYESKKVGDSLTFIRPPSEQK